MAAAHQPRRIGGQQGSVYLQSTTDKLLDSYMWQYEEQQIVLDATVKGESFKRYMPDVGEGRVRIQSFVEFPGLATPLTSLLSETLVTTGIGIPVDFILCMIDPGSIIVGQGYIIRSQLHVVRDGILTDEIEIQVDGRPTTVK